MNEKIVEVPHTLVQERIEEVPVFPSFFTVYINIYNIYIYISYHEF